MLSLAWLVVLPVAADAPDLKEFPKQVQSSALTATVKVANVTRGVDGSGVIVGQSGPHVYVLTAAHVIDQARRLEIHTFSNDSPPSPLKVYEGAEVVARSKDSEDLALVRLATKDEMAGALKICPPESIPTGKRFAALSVGCEGGVPSLNAETVNGRKTVRRPGAPGLTMWEIQSRPLPGRSGGPLLDSQGRLLGVCSGANAGEGYYTHTEILHAFLKANGYRWLYQEEP
jgi:S1-C subfamily serine protease